MSNNVSQIASASLQPPTQSSSDVSRFAPQPSTNIHQQRSPQRNHITSTRQSHTRHSPISIGSTSEDDDCESLDLTCDRDGNEDKYDEGLDEHKSYSPEPDDGGIIDSNGLQLVGRTIVPKRKGGCAFGGKRFRWWFFTWNNPTDPEDRSTILEASWIQYAKFQYEKGESGTLHYQGVLYARNLVSCNVVRAHIPNCGYFAPVKDIEGAVDYCGKAETRIDGPWTCGKPPMQGKRTDLLECKSIIDNGGRMDEVFELQFGNAVRYGRGLQQYINIVDKKNPRTWQTACYVYGGDAGLGKSEAAKAEVEAFGGSVFWLALESGLHGKVWWDGYDGQENVVIDEFEQQIRLNDLKRIIDSTPFKVPVKGAMVEFKAKRVWILSNSLPETWYRTVAPEGSAQRDALMRRMHYVEKFLKPVNGGLGRFQGQECKVGCTVVRCPTCFSLFEDSRRFFVECQIDGTYSVETRGPGMHPGSA